MTSHARPTIYNGIQMRSRLEAGYAAWLDKWKFDWAYEPSAFATEHGQYLPDFRLNDVPVADPGAERFIPQTVYVEVKPASFWDGYDGIDPTPKVAKVEAQAKIMRACEPDAVFAVASNVPHDPTLWLTDFMRWHNLANSVDMVPLGFYRWRVARGDTSRLVLDRDGFRQTARPWPDGYWEPTP